MDFLDIPTVHLLGPMFFEHHPDALEQATEIDANSPCRFSWRDTVAHLAHAPETAPGVREIELGSPALATIALHVTRLDAGASMSVEPTTMSAICAVMQGAGEAIIDGQTFAFARGDALAAPSSCAQTWTASEESYILRVSDKPLLERLDWLRPVPAR
jgi:gentisate 1,2-dioxygenase